MIEDRLPPPAPAMDDPRYLIEDPHAIKHLLEELQRRAIPVSVQSADSEQLAASLVLDVSPGQHVVLDGSSVEAVNARLARSKRLYCTAELDKVEIRFAVDDVNVVRGEDGTRFVTAWPDRVFHHQRREVFRLPTPVNGSPELTCVPDRHAPAVTLRIADISVGGIGIQHDLHPDLLMPGSFLDNCRISLPDGHLDGIRLQVANERMVTTPDGRTLRRAGLAFVSLPRFAQNAISRYIFSVERQRNARRQGND